MMTDEEVVRALWCHADADLLCGECSYEGTSDCGRRMAADAADLLEFTLARNAEMEKQISVGKEANDSCLKYIESLKSRLSKKTEQAEDQRILCLDADRIREGMMDKEMRRISENMRLKKQLTDTQRQLKAGRLPPERGEG